MSSVMVGIFLVRLWDDIYSLSQLKHRYKTKDVQRRIRECHEKLAEESEKVLKIEKGQRHIYEENRVFGA